MKNYTDIEQSKKLAEILPIESVDMYYHYIVGVDSYYDKVPKYIQVFNHFVHFNNDIPCWSLAALLDYLSANFYVDIKYLDDCWELDCRVQVTYDKELINACYEMIIKLHEQNLL